MMGDKLCNLDNKIITLTQEQEACMKYAGDKTLMIKGMAGAGKSLVIMNLAKKALESVKNGDVNKIAIFTYQNTLVATTKEMLEVNKVSDAVVVSTISSYAKQVYEELVRLKKAPDFKIPYEKFAKTNKEKIIKKAMVNHQAKYGKHRFNTSVDYDFWKEEFEWMKDMNVWHDDMDYYLTIQRKGRGSKVRMNVADRVTAYQLYTYYLQTLEAEGQGDWGDYTLFLVRHEDLIPEKYKYKFVFIDEAQDLSLAQMELIKRLFTKGLTIAMDMNQRIHSKMWTPKQLGIDTVTKKLTKSMRTTVQIDALAESVRRKNDELLSEDDKSLRAIPEREGEKPKLVCLADAAAEKKYVTKTIKTLLKNEPRITIGIIASKNNQIYTFGEWMTDAGIEYEVIQKDKSFSLKSPGVKIATAFGAKGLEFDVVIIPNFAEGYFPYKFSSDDEEEMQQFMIKCRNMVYVAMTRARNLLFITWWGNGGSRFIADMDKTLYDAEGEKFNIKIPKEKFSREKGNKENIPVTKNPYMVENKNIGEKAILSRIVDDDKRAQIEALLWGDKSPKVEKISTSSEDDLKSYLKQKGLEVIDKREKGGSLWVVGGIEIDKILKESQTKFNAKWTFAPNGSGSTKQRPAWFTVSKK